MSARKRKSDAFVRGPCSRTGHSPRARIDDSRGCPQRCGRPIELRAGVEGSGRSRRGLHCRSRRQVLSDCGKKPGADLPAPPGGALPDRRQRRRWLPAPAGVRSWDGPCWAPAPSHPHEGPGRAVRRTTASGVPVAAETDLGGVRAKTVSPPGAVVGFRQWTSPGVPRGPCRDRGTHLGCLLRINASGGASRLSLPPDGVLVRRQGDLLRAPRRKPPGHCRESRPRPPETEVIEVFVPATRLRPV